MAGSEQGDRSCNRCLISAVRGQGRSDPLAVDGKHRVAAEEIDLLVWRLIHTTDATFRVARSVEHLQVAEATAAAIEDNVGLELVAHRRGLE